MIFEYYIFINFIILKVTNIGRNELSNGSVSYTGVTQRR